MEGRYISEEEKEEGEEEESMGDAKRSKTIPTAATAASVLSPFSALPTHNVSHHATVLVRIFTHLLGVLLLIDFFFLFSFPFFLFSFFPFSFVLLLFPFLCPSFLFPLLPLFTTVGRRCWCWKEDFGSVACRLTRPHHSSVTPLSSSPFLLFRHWPPTRQHLIEPCMFLLCLVFCIQTDNRDFATASTEICEQSAAED